MTRNIKAFFYEANQKREHQKRKSNKMDMTEKERTVMLC